MIVKKYVRLSEGLALGHLRVCMQAFEAVLTPGKRVDYKRVIESQRPRMVQKRSRMAGVGLNSTYGTVRCGGWGLSHGILRR